MSEHEANREHLLAISAGVELMIDTAIDTRPSYDAVNLPLLDNIPLKVTKILDIGCGTGGLSAALKQRGNCEIVGITWSAEEARKARGVLDTVLIEDLNSLAIDSLAQDFDCIICSHVLEHLVEPQELLRKLRRCLRGGGIVVIALPNTLHWRQRIKFLSGSFRYTSGGVMDSTHLRFYDWNSAQAMVTKAGYVIQDAVAVGNLPLPGLRRVIPKALSSRIDLAASHLLPGVFGSQFIISAAIEK